MPYCTIRLGGGFIRRHVSIIGRLPTKVLSTGPRTHIAACARGVPSHPSARSRPTVPAAAATPCRLNAIRFTDRDPSLAPALTHLLTRNLTLTLTPVWESKRGDAHSVHTARPIPWNDRDESRKDWHKSAMVTNSCCLGARTRNLGLFVSRWTAWLSVGLQLVGLIDLGRCSAACDKQYKADLQEIAGREADPQQMPEI